MVVVAAVAAAAMTEFLVLLVQKKPCRCRGVKASMSMAISMMGLGISAGAFVVKPQDLSNDCRDS